MRICCIRFWIIRRNGSLDGFDWLLPLPRNIMVGMAPMPGIEWLPIMKTI
jgi:hypothetical protein